MSDALRFAALTHSGGALVKTRHQRPCTIYQEFALSGPTERLSRIVFRNYYCASITLMQDVGEEGEVQWEAILERRLMQDPHYEGDAQDYHCLFVDEFAAGFDPSRLSKVRFYLSQPSPSWLKFELQDVSFFAAVEAPATSPAPSPRRSAAASAPSYAARFGFAQNGPLEGRLYRDTEPGATTKEDGDSPLPGSLRITDSSSTSEVEAQLQQALCSVRRELLHHEALAKRHAPHTTGLGSCSPMGENVARVTVNPKAHTLPMPTGTPNRVVSHRGGR